MAKEIKKVEKATPKRTKAKDEKENITGTTKKVQTAKITSKKETTKATGKKSTKKITSSKASSTKKETTRKNNLKTTTKKVVDNKNTILEYYDLPYRYNETIIKLLAQTPSVLFVYWDISENDRANFLKQYGENFFTDTKPVLVVHNTTKNYTFEIEINDFANCWYLNVGDTRCKYYIELGRRSTSSAISIPNDYLYITSSNIIESPNNCILLENNSNVINFKNLKTGEINSKDISSMQYTKNLGKIYNIYELYNKHYSDVTSNPTSGLF